MHWNRRHTSRFQHSGYKTNQINNVGRERVQLVATARPMCSYKAERFEETEKGETQSKPKARYGPAEGEKVATT
jgi:hypothetical protein